MNKREQYYTELLKVTIHCFDLMRYRRFTDRINFSVWANFRGQTYYSGDIFVDPESFCFWNGSKWILYKHQSIIKIRGIQSILDDLEKNYVENNDKKR